jgi:hypothetical protein
VHPRAWLYVLGALSDHAPLLDRAGVEVVEFGGSTRTGGYVLRRVLPWCSWTSVDIAPSDGDLRDGVVQGDAARWGRRRSANVVVATELLEHVPGGHRFVDNARRLLRPGGLFVATMAGPARLPHGATGDPEPAPGEFYRNVEPATLLGWLRGAGFESWSIDLTDDALDLRCTARAT